MSRSELSRRDFLKRGTVLGGAVVWATPIVQIVGMRPALAQDVSGCDKIYAIKINIVGDVGDEPPPTVDCENIEDQTAGSPPAACITTPEETAGDPCDKIATVDFEDDKVWTIRFTEGCEYQDGAVGLKPGGGPACAPDEDWDVTEHADGRGLTFTYRGDDGAISHVEFVFCCNH